MDYPRIASKAEWLAARKQLLIKEKEATRQRDALSAERRKLPMVKIEKEYTFEGPNGRKTLRELFENRRQLIVYHFMFDPSWDEGCKSCSHFADNFAGSLVHLTARDTCFAVVYLRQLPRGSISRADRFLDPRDRADVGVDRMRQMARIWRR